MPTDALSPDWDPRADRREEVVDILAASDAPLAPHEIATRASDSVSHVARALVDLRMDGRIREMRTAYTFKYELSVSEVQARAP